MPAYFQLYPKNSDEPAKFADVDDKMRAHFNAPPDPDKYLCGWYDSIGMRLALGQSFDEIRAEWFSYNEAEGYDELIDILDWLEANYTPNSWTQIGR